jgi:ketosteroid isomerase-like protein
MDDRTTTSTLATVDAFNEAFNRHDVDAVMTLMTDDVVFENTAPPDGERFVGQDAVRAAWTSFFASSPSAHFDAEEIVGAGEHAVVCWRYSWRDDSDEQHVRGIDLVRVHDSKVAEKRSYVKG